jgi:hypothetical protein
MAGISGATAKTKMATIVGLGGEISRDGIQSG